MWGVGCDPKHTGSSDYLALPIDWIEATNIAPRHRLDHHRLVLLLTDCDTGPTTVCDCSSDDACYHKTNALKGRRPMKDP